MESLPYASEEALFDSSGVFTMDPQRALELLQGALTFDPQDTLSFGLLAAIMGGARKISGSWRQPALIGGGRVLDNGPRLTPGQAQQLLQADLTMEERLFWLFRALQAGRNQGVRYISGSLMLSWSSGKLKLTRGLNSEADLFGRNLLQLGGGANRASLWLARLTLYHAPPQLKRPPNFPPARVKVPDTALASLHWNGPHPLQTEGTATAILPSPAAASAVVWLNPPAVRRGSLMLLKKGLWLETVDLPEVNWSWSGVLWHDELAYDLGGKVIHDEKFQALLTQLDQFAEELFLQLPPEQRALTEPTEPLEAVEAEVPPLPLLPGILSVALNRAGNRLLTRSDDQARLWALNKRQEWDFLAALPPAMAEGFSFSPDGKHFALATHSRAMLFDSQQGRCLETWTFPVRALRFSSAERTLFLLTLEGELFRLPLERRPPVKLLQARKGFDWHPQPLEISPDGRTVLLNQVHQLTVAQSAPFHSVERLRCFQWMAFLPKGQGMVTRDHWNSSNLTLRRSSNLREGMPIFERDSGERVFCYGDTLYRSDLAQGLNLNTGLPEPGVVVPELSALHPRLMVGDWLWAATFDGVERVPLTGGVPERVSPIRAQLLSVGEQVVLWDQGQLQIHHGRSGELHSRLQSNLAHHSRVVCTKDEIILAGSGPGPGVLVRLPHGEVETHTHEIVWFHGLKVYSGPVPEVQFPGTRLPLSPDWSLQKIADQYLIYEGEQASLFHPARGRRNLPPGAYRTLADRYLAKVDGSGEVTAVLCPDTLEQLDIHPDHLSFASPAGPKHFYSHSGLLDARGRLVRKARSGPFLGLDPSCQWVLSNSSKLLVSEELLSGKRRWSTPLADCRILHWCAAGSNHFCAGAIKGKFDPERGSAEVVPCQLTDAQPHGRLLIQPFAGGASFYSWEERLLARIFLFEDGFLLLDSQGHYEWAGQLWARALGDRASDLMARPGLFQSIWSENS